MTESDNPFAGYTRRKFLNDLGKAGGAGAVYGAMGALGLFAAPLGAQPTNFVPPGQLRRGRGGSGKHVIVLGAGIAGLTAAYELGKAGYKVTLLEGRNRSGGRNWTVRGGDTETETDGVTQMCQFDQGEYMNAGPARLPQHHVTIEYCRELGVPLEVFTNQNADAYYYNEGSGFGPLGGEKVRHRTAKADLYGYTAQLLAKAADQGALDIPLSDADRELLIGFMRSFGNLTGSNNYEGSTRRGFRVSPSAGSQRGEVDPPFALSDLLQSRFGLRFAFEFGWDQAMLMFQPVGGMDAIPKALENAIRPTAKSIYGAKVSGIYNSNNGVRVEYQDNSRVPKQIEGDYCICTIPPQILKNIPSNFSSEVVDALDVPVPVSTGKIGLQYRRRFWEEDEKILGGITNTNLNVSTIWYPSHGYLGRKGVVVGYYNFGGNANFYSDLDPRSREQEALMQGAKIHGPAYINELENSFSVSWIKTPFSEGGWVGWPTSGGERVPAYDLLNQPEGNVHFAGDHLSYYIAWQAGAFDSARKVVMEIEERASA